MLLASITRVMPYLYAIVVEEKDRAEAERLLREAIEETRRDIGFEDPWSVIARFEVKSGMTQMQKKFRSLTIRDYITHSDLRRIESSRFYRQIVRKLIERWARKHAGFEKPVVIYLATSFDTVRDPPAEEKEKPHTYWLYHGSLLLGLAGGLVGALIGQKLAKLPAGRYALPCLAACCIAAGAYCMYKGIKTYLSKYMK